MLKNLLAFIVCVSVIAAIACDKSSSQPPVEESGSETKTTEPAADKKAPGNKAAPDEEPVPDEEAAHDGHGSLDKEAATPSEAPEGFAFPAWKKYENSGFGLRVMAPSTSPTPVNQDQPEQKLTNRSFQFMLSTDSLGQIVYLEIGGDEKLDIIAGLDGACKQSVVGINGTMTKYEKVKSNGREARDFEFTATSGGISWKGYGHGVVSGPRTVKAAMAFYGVGSSDGDKRAKAFMSSFEAD